MTDEKRRSMAKAGYRWMSPDVQAPSLPPDSRLAHIAKWIQESPKKTLEHHADCCRVQSKRAYAYQKVRRGKDENFAQRQTTKAQFAYWLRSESRKTDQKLLSLCGATREELKAHLERGFTEGMNWDNQGEWHVDHVRALSRYDLTDPVQMKQAWHITNLQPLWARDNFSKGSK